MDEVTQFPPSQWSEDEQPVRERKLRDALYELNSKRALLKVADLKVHEVALEKHELERAVDKMKKELAEAKIQLEVAVKAVRKGETARLGCNETMARHEAQFEAVIKERDLLQEEMRNLEMENTSLKRQLEQAEAKLKNYSSFQESCQAKQGQVRTALDSLSQQVGNLEQDHIKINRMHSALITMCEKAVLWTALQKQTLQDTMKERNSLRKKILSLTAEVDKLNLLSIKQEISEDKEKCELPTEDWVTAREEMESRLKERSEEYFTLQNALDSTLMTLSTAQAREEEMKKEIKALERDVERLKQKRESKDFSQQTEDIIDEEDNTVKEDQSKDPN